MKKITLNTKSHPELSDEEILSKQDFHSLLQKNKVMKNKTFNNKKNYWVAAATLMLAVLGSYFFFMKNDLQPSISTKAFIQPPIPTADVPYDYFTINSTKDTTIIYKTGSKIIIPAHAFKNNKGEIIEGNVQLSYREIKSLAAIFLSGIPMEYDSSGKKFHFESAGMFDIGAKQNDENLQTNETALINVKMTSTNPERRFNSYYLDTVAKKWAYLESRKIEKIEKRDSIVFVNEEHHGSTKPTEEEGSNADDYYETKDETTQAVSKIEKEVKKMKAEKPIAPAKADNSRPTFHIEIDPKEFPEIAMYNNVQFQVVNPAEYIASKSKILWNDVTLEKTKTAGQYWVIFSTANETYKILGTPVLKGTDFDAAVKVYDQKFAAYEEKLSEKKAEEERLKKEMEEKALAQKKVYEAYQAKVAAEEEANRQAQMKAMENQANSEMVYRVFQISRFGMYNSDCPQSLPSGENILAIFNSENGNPLNDVYHIYLVDKSTNTMFNYYLDNASVAKVSSFKFNPDNKNMVWIVNSKNEIGIVSVVDFQNLIQNKKKKVEFLPKFIDRKFKNYEEVKKVLEI
ncbi:MAG: hypothetical protein RL708_2676 [Bacteroidota bacterium]